MLICSSLGKKRMHMEKRNTLFSPMGEGGWGFHSAKLVNHSLVLKQVWRIIMAGPSSFIGFTHQSKFVDWNNQSFLLKPYNSSWMWNHMHSCSNLITQNLSQSIGNGCSIPLNHPLWWLMQHSFIITTVNGSVANLLSRNSSWSKLVDWNHTLLQFLYPTESIQEISQLPICINNDQDCKIWSLGSIGNYSAKEGFQFLNSQNGSGIESNFWKFLCSISLPNKFILFIWKLLHKAIPSFDILQDHHLQTSQD